MEGLKSREGAPSPKTLGEEKAGTKLTGPQGVLRASALDPCRFACKTVVVSLMSASLLSLAVAVILCTGNLVDNLIQKNLVIKNGSEYYERWKNPPVGTLVKIKLFNYTNVEAYLKKIDKKLKIQEVGPYVYRLKVSKMNVEFPESDGGEIVSFQENKLYEFAPELSPGFSEDDVIVTPNFNLIGLASVIHDSHYALKLALMGMLNVIKTEPFLSLPAGDLLWGYDDPIFDKAKEFVTFERGEIQMKKFGLLAGEVGLSLDQISVHTGLNDPSRLGVISTYNGEDSLPFWGGEECNRVDGSEGSIFPRIDAGCEESRATISVFSPHLCRRFPFQRLGKVVVALSAGDIPAVRFAPPPDVYESPLDRPEHRCFCDPQRSFCPPSGAFNVSPCAYGAPVMISFPHFYNGHPSLVEHFEGLDPETKHHEFYLDIEPTLGVPLRAESAFQMNAMVRPTWVIKELVTFPPNLIMPLFWAQAVTDEIPDYLSDQIKFLTQTSFLIENVLIYTLFSTGVILMAIVILLVSGALGSRGQRRSQSSKSAIGTTTLNNSAAPEKV